MFTNGQLMPDLKGITQNGDSVSIWDFHQKSHIVFIHEPDMTQEKIQGWMNQIQSNKSLWTWLDVKFIQSTHNSSPLEHGTYIIDRYRKLIQFLPSHEWNLEKIEKNIISYEAFHC